MSMSISGVSNNLQINGTSQWQQNRQYYNQLSQALQSGNLTAAQSAYQSLAANTPNSSDPNSPLFQVGQALSAGNISAAQQAFAAIGSHHHGSATGAASSTTTAGTAAITGSQPLATSGSVGTLFNQLV